jgi:protease IV
MKLKWLWIGLAITGIVLLFVTVMLGSAIFLIGNESMGWGDGVGLLEVKGLIVDSEETVRQLEELKKNDRVKAIVLRVDSPGGVVGPSQEIYAEVRKVAAGKKVVVSMGSLAASGGYYISVPATMIMANPGTITGSIGVLMKISNIEGLLGKVGMKAFTLKTGKFKDAGSPLRDMTEQDKAMLQGVINDAHNQFVNAVADGRKLPVEEIRKLADGRIFTGNQALALKLIDRTGTLQDAIEEAGKLAGIKGEPRVIRPARKQSAWIDMLVEETASRISELARQEKGISVSYEFDGAIH